MSCSVATQGPQGFEQVRDGSAGSGCGYKLRTGALSKSERTPLLQPLGQRALALALVRLVSIPQHLRQVLQFPLIAVLLAPAGNSVHEGAQNIFLLADKGPPCSQNSSYGHPGGTAAAPARPYRCTGPPCTQL